MAARPATMLTAVPPDALAPRPHPIRRIKPLVDRALAQLSPTFDRMYAVKGRASIPPKQPRSEERFSVEGTLLEAWASVKSFRPRDEDAPSEGGGRNPEVDFRGEQRRHGTHRSTTDPEARLAKQGKNKEARLCFGAHVLMDNRNGLVVDVGLTPATGTGEGAAAGARRITVGADRGYDTRDLVKGCRQWRVTPHLAQQQRSAIDRRTTGPVRITGHNPPSNANRPVMGAKAAPGATNLTPSLQPLALRSPLPRLTTRISTAC